MRGLHGLGQAYGGGRLGNVASVKLHAVTRDLTDGGSSTSALRTVRPKFSSSRTAATTVSHPSASAVVRYCLPLPTQHHQKHKPPRRFAPCRLDADDILGRSSWGM